MKKIINGRLYNTDTAQYIGYSENGYMPGDVHFTREELYRKKNGEFFFYCQGGAFSQYSEPCDGGTCAGSTIILTTDEMAREWAEEHLSVDKYLNFWTAEE